MINDNIVITIVDSRNGQCKIAIEADKDVKIYREEIKKVAKRLAYSKKVRTFAPVKQKDMAP